MSFSKKKVLLFLCLSSVLFYSESLEAKTKSVPRPTSQIFVTPPPVATIASITVVGDYYLSKRVLVDALTFSKGDVYNASDVTSAVARLRDMGLCRTASVEAVQLKEGYAVTIKINEQPQIGEVIIDGASAVPSRDLYAIIGSKDDSAVNPKTVQNDIASINATYQSRGFLGCSVTNVIPPETDGDPLVYAIQEIRLERILTTGNSLTKPYVILREMDTKPGAVVNSITLKDDLRRVFNLNYFSNIVPRFLPGSTPTSQILILDMTEKRSGSLSFGGGYSAVSGLTLFTNLFWDNMFGSGQTIMLNGDFGKASTYQFKYFNPWMWDTRKSFTWRVWQQSGQVSGINPLNSSDISYTNQNSFGTDFGFGFPVSRAVYVNHRFKLEKVSLLDTKKNYSIQSYQFQISYDNRDYIVNPTSGQYDTLTMEKGFQMFRSSLDFTRFDFEQRNFFKVVDKQVIATRVALGYILSERIKDTDLFAREYYRVGGANTVRGYGDFAPFAIGDKQVVANLEYRFYLEDAFQLLLFVDAGYAPDFTGSYGDAKDTDVSITNFSHYKIGKGIGTRITVPMLGLIRLDFGINDQGNQYLHFSMGQTF